MWEDTMPISSAGLPNLEIKGAISQNNVKQLYFKELNAELYVF